MTYIIVAGSRCFIFVSNFISMKSVWAFMFVFLYFLAMLRPVFPVFEYVINQDYIAEFLCVNKDRTELECKGKCYLMQRLAENDEQKKQNLPKIAMEEYPIGFVELFGLKTPTSPNLLVHLLPKYKNSYSYLYSYSSFHPPSF